MDKDGGGTDPLGTRINQINVVVYSKCWGKDMDVPGNRTGQNNGLNKANVLRVARISMF